VVDVSCRVTLTLGTGGQASFFSLQIADTLSHLPARFPSFPGQGWRLAPSSCHMVALGDADPLERPTPSCLFNRSNAFLTTWRLQWTSKDAFQSLRVRNGVWRPPADEWSHRATLTLWRGADSILPLELLKCFPNGLAVPMDLEGRFPKPPGQEWRLALQHSYGH